MLAWEFSLFYVLSFWDLVQAPTRADHLKLSEKQLDNFQLSGLFPAQIISDNILILNKSDRPKNLFKHPAAAAVNIALHCSSAQDDNMGTRA